MADQLSADSFTAATKHFKPEAVFVILALLFGVAFVFVTGPLQVSDESLHFFRAYHISQGDFISISQGDVVGGRIPESLVHLNRQYEHLVYHPEIRIDKPAMQHHLHESFDADKKIFVSFQLQALYAPVVYFPQAMGIVMGRLCGLSALKIMYLGRITNLLCWILMTCIAIRIVPVFKWVFFLAAMLPMNISQAASLSADGPTNAIAILLTALILHSAFSNNQKISQWQALGMILLSVLLSLAKQAYLPLVGMTLLIPVSKFGRWSHKILFCGIAIVASALATGLWSQVIRGLYIPLGQENVPEQMSFVMKCPWTFPCIAVNSLVTYWRGIAASYIGVLGWIQVWLPFWIYFSFPCVLVVAALFDGGSGVSVKWFHRSWILFLCAGVFLLVELSMYLAWTKPGEMLVEGVQGRYFLPITIPVLLALFYNRWLKLAKPIVLHLAVVFYSAAVLTAACWTVYERYFGPVT